MTSVSTEVIEALLKRPSPLLAFPPEAERCFQEAIREKRIRHVFCTSMVGALLYLLFAVSDYVLLPDIYPVAWGFRFLLALPLFMLVCFNFHRIDDHRWREVLVGCTAWVLGLATSWIVTQSRAVHAAQELAGFCLFMVYSNVVVRFRFMLSFLLSVVFFLFFVVLLWRSPHVPFEVGVNYLVLLFSTAVMSLLANYWHEREERRSFLLAERDALRKRELQRANDRLEGLSYRDGLTSLYNKRYFDMLFPKLLAAARQESRPLCVLFIDVDHFKAYNDNYGHLAGDQALVWVAQLIGAGFRRRDEIAARTGGEEFVGLLSGVSAAQALEIAETLRDNVQQLALPHAHSPTADVLTVSIGIAASPPGRAVDAHALLSAADAALYAAKQRGRNRVVLLDDAAQFVRTEPAAAANRDAPSRME